jgi:hypothetical protein
MPLDSNDEFLASEMVVSVQEVWDFLATLDISTCYPLFRLMVTSMRLDGAEGSTKLFDHREFASFFSKKLPSGGLGEIDEASFKPLFGPITKAIESGSAIIISRPSREQQRKEPERRSQFSVYAVLGLERVHGREEGRSQLPVHIVHLETLNPGTDWKTFGGLCEAPEERDLDQGIVAVIEHNFAYGIRKWRKEKGLPEWEENFKTWSFPSPPCGVQELSAIHAIINSHAVSRCSAPLVTLLDAELERLAREDEANPGAWQELSRLISKLGGPKKLRLGVSQIMNDRTSWSPNSRSCEAFDAGAVNMVESGLPAKIGGPLVPSFEDLLLLEFVVNTLLVWMLGDGGEHMQAPNKDAYALMLRANREARHTFAQQVDRYPECRNYISLSISEPFDGWM